MKGEHKSLVVLADTNPIRVKLSRELRTVNKISLVYFKLQGFNLNAPPYNLWIKVGGVQSLETETINSCIPNNTPGTYKTKTNDIVPLHFKLEDVYLNGAGNAVQYQVISGFQKKGMRWCAKNVSNMTDFEITLLDDLNEVYPLVLGAKLELVFEVEWLPSQLQSPLWKTDRTYMNSMNS